jgi:hypothetical protein
MGPLVGFPLLGILEIPIGVPGFGEATADSVKSLDPLGNNPMAHGHPDPSIASIRSQKITPNFHFSPKFF